MVNITDVEYKFSLKNLLYVVSELSVLAENLSAKFAPEERVILAAIQSDQMTHKMKCNKNFSKSKESKIRK